MEESFAIDTVATGYCNIKLDNMITVRNLTVVVVRARTIATVGINNNILYIYIR